MSTDDRVSLEERPNWRDYEEPEPRHWGLWALLLLFVAMLAGLYFGWGHRESLLPDRFKPATPTPAPAPQPEALPAEPEKPEILHPVPEVEAEPDKPLPALDQSDPRIGELVTGLMGKKAFDSFVGPEQLIRRIVVTVDNLPRKVAPVRMRAVRPVPGKFVPGASNRSRYAAHVKLFQALDARALVQGYVKLYPLFQKAYDEAGGRPGGYFNDRVVEALDDMLAAPDLESPPGLVQPKVLYLYADPALEGRSAGQKIMMRLGAGNAAKIKAKLREIRKELTAAGGKLGGDGEKK